MIKLGCSDYTFPLLSHESVVRHVSGMGLEAIDLGLFGNRSHLRPETIRLDPAAWAGRIAERLDQAGLELADVFLLPWTDLDRMGTNNPDKAERAEGRALFVDILEFARRLNAPGMTMAGGLVYGGETVTASLRRSAEELNWRIEAGERYGVEIRVEGGVGQNIDTPASLLELIGMAPGLKATFDFAHYTYQDMGNADVEPLLEHAGHIQIRGGAPGRMQTTFQENECDFGWMIDRLVELGYDRFMTIEYVWMHLWDCDRTENTMETIQFRDFVRARIEGRDYEPTERPI
jgi:sugar phosphate isomerase/epimerase